MNLKITKTRYGQLKLFLSKLLCAYTIGTIVSIGSVIAFTIDIETDVETAAAAMLIPLFTLPFLLLYLVIEFISKVKWHKHICFIIPLSLTTLFLIIYLTKEKIIVKDDVAALFFVCLSITGLVEYLFLNWYNYLTRNQHKV